MSGDHEKKDKKLFGFLDLGNAITILLNIIALGYFVGTNAQILKQHSEDIQGTQNEIKIIKQELKEITVYGTAVDKNLQSVTIALDSKLSRIDSTLNKLDIVANDMDWLKRWLSAHEDMDVTGMKKDISAVKDKLGIKDTKSVN